MYAYIPEIGCGFFDGVCGLENWPLTFRDPPLPHWLSLMILCHRLLSLGAGMRLRAELALQRPTSPRSTLGSGYSL